jgi:hypothetical protein
MGKTWHSTNRRNVWSLLETGDRQLVQGKVRAQPRRASLSRAVHGANAGNFLLLNIAVSSYHEGTDKKCKSQAP